MTLRMNFDWFFTYANTNQSFANGGAGHPLDALLRRPEELHFGAQKAGRLPLLR